MANNEAALGKTLGNYGNQFDQAQYDRTANLEQQFLQTDLQNQQNNKLLGGNWEQQFLNNDLQNQQNNKALGGNWFEQDQAQRFGCVPERAAIASMAAAGAGYGEQGLAMDRDQSTSCRRAALERGHGAATAGLQLPAAAGGEQLAVQAPGAAHGDVQHCAGKHEPANVHV
jgi:hypothetical protein